MKLRRKWKALGVLVLAALLGAVILFEYGAKEETCRIILIPKVEDKSNDFWTSLLEGARMAAQEYNADLKITAPASEEDWESQNRLIAAAIEEKPDVIVLAPSSYTEVTEGARKIKEAGIPLVLLDSCLDQSLEDVRIGTDNFEAAREMGRFMKEKASGAVIGVVSYIRDSSTAMEREKGLLSGLGGWGDGIVQVVYCDSDYDKAYEETLDMLERHPDMNLIFGLNEYAAVGAARAVSDLGLTDQIEMMGFDNSLEEIQLLEQGVFSGIVIQKPFSMGYLGVEKAVDLHMGRPVEKEVFSGSEIITKETIYTEENQKLLFPF